jgi:8-oxo-dGTP pyrophosphatase MutT (NUDIX family)
MKVKRYAGVIVRYEDRFLICKRNFGFLNQGEWSIPAGKIESCEKIEDSAKREFREETDVSIDDQNLIFAGIIPRYSKDGSKIKGLMYTYQIKVSTAIRPDLENAVDGNEHTDWGYFTLDEMKNMKINAFLYKLFEFISN